MRITEEKLRALIREELINEGFFDMLKSAGQKLMKGLNLTGDSIEADMPVDEAKQQMQKAFAQLTVSIASSKGELSPGSIQSSQKDALAVVKSLMG